MLRAVSAICAVCFALAIYSGHRIISETHLHTGPSPIPGGSSSLHRDSTAALEQAQRIRASVAIAGARPAFSLAAIWKVLDAR